jgi:hypothetical protein
MHGILVGKSSVKIPLGRYRLRWKDNIKFDIEVDVKVWFVLKSFGIESNRRLL